MKIKTDIEYYAPSGFYCKRNGGNKCTRLNEKEHDIPYCELFYPFLDTNWKGDILKCEQCLMAERKQRLSE